MVSINNNGDIIGCKAYQITQTVIGLLPTSLRSPLPDTLHLARALHAVGYHLLESNRPAFATDNMINITTEKSIVEFIIGFIWLEGCASTHKVVSHIAHVLWCLDLLPHVAKGTK